MEHTDQTEQMIKDLGADKAPRVTIERINSIIKSEHTFTAADALAVSGQEADKNHPLARLTFCVLVLENGFTVTGESACVSPENFNAEIGRKIARDNAINKIWLLEGYALQSKLHEQK